MARCPCRQTVGCGCKIISLRVQFKGLSAESAIQCQHGFHRRTQLKRAFSASFTRRFKFCCGKVTSLTPQLYRGDYMPIRTRSRFTGLATRDSPFKGILSILLVDCLRNLVDTPLTAFIQGAREKSGWCGKAIHATRFGDSKPAMKKLHFSSIFSDVRELRTGIFG
jgi:hypothetical protein